LLWLVQWWPSADALFTRGIDVRGDDGMMAAVLLLVQRFVVS
jgi:hypothetical protein